MQKWLRKCKYKLTLFIRPINTYQIINQFLVIVRWLSVVVSDSTLWQPRGLCCLRIINEQYIYFQNVILMSLQVYTVTITYIIFIISHVGISPIFIQKYFSSYHNKCISKNNFTIFADTFLEIEHVQFMSYTCSLLLLL